MNRRLLNIFAVGSLGYIFLNRYGKKSIHSVAVRMARGALGVSDHAVTAKSKVLHGWQDIVEEARGEKETHGSTERNILPKSFTKMGNAISDSAVDLMYRSAEVLENAAFKLESRYEHEQYEDIEEEEFHTES